jgi:hypothetical protein
MGGGFGAPGSAVLGGLVGAQQRVRSWGDFFYGGVLDPSALQGMPSLSRRLSWEETLKSDLERFAADQMRAAKRRTRRAGFLLAVPFLFLLVEMALAYFYP